MTNKFIKGECSDRTDLILGLATESCQDLIKALLADQFSLDESDLLSLAASLLQLFVIDNFTGPTNEESLKIYETLPHIYKTLKSKFDHRTLAKDGSDVYHRILNPWLMKLAQLCWNNINGRELESLVWKHRHLTVHLMIMLEPSETLIGDLRKVQEAILNDHIKNTQLTRLNIVETCCELIQSALLRGDFTSSRKILDYASELSGISIEHTGVLGRRTRFQQRDIPQLVVRAKEGDRANSEKQENIDLPKDVALQDDTLLPDISFVSTDEKNLSTESQLLMVAKLDYILKTEVMEESLKDEWTLSYLRSIINSSSIWSLKFKALGVRSTVERKNFRKMDRSLLQMEELIKLLSKDDGLPSRRLELFYSVLPLPSWQIQKTLGDISVNLGLFKNALDVYLSIEHWEGIINCYCALGQNVKAEKIIRQELEKHETPYMLCLLGDVTENIEHYEKSWVLSKGRFARAKKSLGTYYYTKKQFEEAITHYELAHKANPSNLSTLSMLAYSCLTLKRYESAAEYYRRITYMDDNNFLAWNNLSKAYIKLGQKERAWRTLREAIKCNFEEWKIWENFMLVSMDIGAIDDVLTAWHRILDIKSPHNDDLTLGRLTISLIRRPANKADEQYMELLKNSLKLVARLISTSGCSTRLWICYFKLLVKELELLDKSGLDHKVCKIINALQRATPTTDPTFTQVPEKVVRLLDCYDELADCYNYAFELIGPRPDLWRQWRSFKLSAFNVLKTIRLVY